MQGFVRTMAAVMAVLLGLPTLLMALGKSLTTIGYPDRPTAAIAENFLEGTDSFIDEAASENWSVGYGKSSLLPDDIDSHRYFLGGFLKFPAQEATGVIDDLCVRAVCLDDNSGRGAVAFAWIDGVGLMNNDVKAIREKLSDITGKNGLISINVGSTHTHSGIDTQGLWGNIPRSGRDEKYLNALIEKTADAIRTAYTTRTAGILYYSAKDCPEMFSDSRNPQSFDKKIHLFRFVPTDTGRKEIYITNFGAHPVNLAWENSELSGDYPYYVEQAVQNTKKVDFIFIQGAIGGGIGCNQSAENGITPDADNLTRLKQYSAKVAEILIDLAQSGTPVEPIINAKHAQVDFEVTNFVFRLAESAGLCNATAFKEDGKIMLASEIGYIEIGKNIKILTAPGEIMPEIVYGNFYSAAESFSGTEYPHKALDTHFADGDDVLVFGLCNDALGYFVPDNDYSASNEDGHYEETVSTGGTSASTLSVAFENLFESLDNLD